MKVAESQERRISVDMDEEEAAAVATMLGLFGNGSVYTDELFFRLAQLVPDYDERFEIKNRTAVVNRAPNLVRVGIDD